MGGGGDRKSRGFVDRQHTTHSVGPRLQDIHVIPTLIGTSKDPRSVCAWPSVLVAWTHCATAVRHIRRSSHPNTPSAPGCDAAAGYAVWSDVAKPRSGGGLRSPGPLARVIQPCCGAWLRYRSAATGSAECVCVHPISASLGGPETWRRSTAHGAFGSATLSDFYMHCMRISRPTSASPSLRNTTALGRARKTFPPSLRAA